METLNQKSIERAVSQRAIQMSSSFPCQICVVGFLSGICLTSLFLAALTSFGSLEIGGKISFSAFSSQVPSSNYSSKLSNGECIFKQKETQRLMHSQEIWNHASENKTSQLYSLWSDLLSETTEKGRQLFGKSREKHNVPLAPHLENCKMSMEINSHLDSRIQSENFPPWTNWKGVLGNFLSPTFDEQLTSHRRQMISEGTYPPWVCFQMRKWTLKGILFLLSVAS